MNIHTSNASGRPLGTGALRRERHGPRSG
jgi:hypothetical protein